MNKSIKNTIGLLVILFSFSLTNISAQNILHKKSAKHQAYLDSLKTIPYPYHLPILGGKIREKGFDIPYPNGFMLNLTTGKMDITLNNVSLSFTGEEDSYLNVDNIVRFSSLQANVDVANIRYDFWLLPFLNFSVLGGYSNNSTDVYLALPFEATFVSNNKGPIAGWGITVAGGVGPLFITSDYNMTWAFMSNLNKPSMAQIFDFRVGHTFTFHNKKAMNLSFLVGTNWIKLAPGTDGQLNLTEKLGVDTGWRDGASEKLDDWYSELNQYDQAKYGDFYNNVDNFLTSGEDTVLHYKTDKSIYYPWSMTLGLNWQVNKRWMFTSIYTFLGSREQMTLGFNYRFGLRGKNVLSGMTF